MKKLFIFSLAMVLILSACSMPEPKNFYSGSTPEEAPAEEAPATEEPVAEAEESDCTAYETGAFPGFICDPTTGEFERIPTPAVAPAFTNTPTPDDADQVIEFNYSPVASDGHYANRVEFTEGDWHRVRETVNRSEIRNGQFVSIPLTGDEHGDWPAWFAEHQVNTDRPTKNGEIFWDIATKMVIAPENEDLWVHYKVRLDQETITELNGEPYFAAASGEANTLGLFLGSQKGVELLVNGEEYYIRGDFCHDCTGSTTLNDLDDYEYNADDLTHFGTAGRGTTDELLIITIEETFDGVIDIVMKVKAGTKVVLWYGVANH